MNNNNEGRNLEEINKKKILNFGDLSRSQSALGIDVNWSEAWIKCERCNGRVKAKWGNSQWNIVDEKGKEWKVYLKKSQLKKHDIGYYIVGGIKFYCPDCDRRHNYLEK